MILATFSSCFLLFPPAAAPAPASPAVQKGIFKRQSPKSNHSQRQIPMAVKDGKASKLRPKTP